jgi:hypothetical protein
MQLRETVLEMTNKTKRWLGEGRTEIRLFEEAEIYLFTIPFYLSVREIPPTS